MQIPQKLTDSFPVYTVSDPSDSNKTVVYSVGPGWMVVGLLMAALPAAFLWTLTALVYWFVWIAGVIF